MKKVIGRLGVLLLLIVIGKVATFSQTTGAIGGTVTDSNGAVVPNATVMVKGQGRQEFTAVSADNGTYRIPAVAAGFYTVTVTANGFKKSVVSNVKADVGLPTTVDSALEAGKLKK